MNSILSELSAAILPGVVALIGTALTVVLNGAARAARQRWGIEIEAHHREALHSAIMTGLLSAQLRGAKQADMIDAAVAHAEASVPDAVAALAPARGVLRSLAQAKALQITGATAR